MTRVLLDRDPPAEDLAFAHSYPLPADWVGPPQVPADNGFWAFKRVVDLPDARRVRIHVSADQRYVLHHNGRRIGRGPERGDLRHWMYETHELDFVPGPNTLVAIVWWLNPTGPTPPPWAQMTQRPGFWLMSDPANDLPELNTGGDRWQVRPIEGVSVDLDQIVHFPASVVGPRVRIDGAAFPWAIANGVVEARSATGVVPGSPVDSPKLAAQWSAAGTVQPATFAARVGGALPYWLLRPAMLPPMRDRPLGGWHVRHVDAPPDRDTVNFAVLAENNIAADALFTFAPRKNADASADRSATDRSVGVPTVAAHTRRRLIIDLKTYACAYSRLKISGGRGSFIRLRWAESLYESAHRPIKMAWDVHDKSDRGEIEGRHFLGTGDTLIAGGPPGRAFEPLWWNAGRYIELLIETAGEPLTVESLDLFDTGYPYEFEFALETSDPRLAKIESIGLHTLRMCSHETAMDCPYYEQLNYAGDTRLQSLIAMATARDDRLVRKGLRLFDWSRTGDTWSMARWPSITSQIIPTFAMWWACMAYDYALWRGDLPFIKTLMPGVRSVLERWREQIGADGLLRQPAGWNFVDWVKAPHWSNGMANPTAGGEGAPVCGILQWQLVYTLMKAAALEDWLGEPMLAERNRQTAAMLAAVAERTFFDSRRQLLASDVDHRHFSEHAHVLALLSGQLSAHLRPMAIAALTGDAPVDRTTLYFRHYALEALAEVGRADLLLPRMDSWFDQLSSGLSTFVEQPEPTRSDCHAWSAHPVYHFYASVLGVRPAAVGFGRVRITPGLGRLAWARGQVVHPRGTIRVDLRRQGDGDGGGPGGRVGGRIELPSGVPGELVLDGEIRAFDGVVNF